MVPQGRNRTTDARIFRLTEVIYFANEFAFVSRASSERRLFGRCQFGDVVASWEQVAIGVHRHDDACVTEALLHNLRRQLPISRVLATSGASHDMPRADANVLGVKFKLVTGYPGVREITLAMDRGEVQGLCAVGIANISGMRPEWFAPGSAMRVIVQESIAGDPDLNKQGVPRTVDFATTPEQRQVLEIVYAQGESTRPFIMAPDIQPDRVGAMRKAFSQALTDPGLLDEAKKLPSISFLYLATISRRGSARSMRRRPRSSQPIPEA